jgi:hypothetical protein
MTLGDIEFQLRTGKMERRKDSPDKFVPDIINISGVDNVLEIEKYCRIRIKENDPTPVVLFSEYGKWSNTLFNKMVQN